MNFMNQEFTDFLLEAGFYRNDDKLEIVIHDRDRREHQAITVNQDPEEVADRLENAAEAIREEAKYRE